VTGHSPISKRPLQNVTQLLVVLADVLFTVDLFRMQAGRRWMLFESIYLSTSALSCEPLLGLEHWRQTVSIGIFSPSSSSLFLFFFPCQSFNPEFLTSYLLLPLLLFMIKRLDMHIASERMTD